MSFRKYIRVSLKSSDGRSIGFYEYDPTDSMSIVRFGHLQSVIHEVSEELKQFDYISPEGRTAGGNTVRLRELEKRLFDAVDYWLGTNSAKHIFKEIRPFASVNGGKFWFSVVLSGIGKKLIPNDADSEKGEKHE